MKKLIFVRHGRAEDLAPEISDFERSLTLKGKIIARLMAGKLKERENSPGLIITSPSFRALETAIIFTQEFGIESDLVRMDDILYYRMNLKYLSKFLSLVSTEVETITLFGHNPAFTEIPDSLSIEGCDFLPKCGVICISFNVRTWKDIKLNTGKTEYFLKPEKLL
jgi:phosphohistidine phosphatase